MKIAPYIATGVLAFGVAYGIAAGPRPSPAPAPAATTRQTDGEYVVDKVHSGLYFKIGHGVGTFLGRFNELSGTFAMDPAKPEPGSMQFTVQTESVDTNNDGRDKHLRSADFFNVKQFAEITFKSKSVTKSANGFDVAGDLTITGTTKPVTVKITNFKTGMNPQNKKESAGFEATLTINRNDFGITKYPGMLGDDVTIVIGIEGAR
ncbi:MAG: YceI family protein [Phycisphaerales bacterium]